MPHEEMGDNSNGNGEKHVRNDEAGGEVPRSRINDENYSDIRKNLTATSPKHDSNNVSEKAPQDSLRNFLIERLSDYDDQTGPPKLNPLVAIANNDHDFNRRKNEMNAFAAMANASYDEVGSPDDNGIEKERQKSEISAFSAMANKEYSRKNFDNGEIPIDSNHESSFNSSSLQGESIRNSQSEGSKFLGCAHNVQNSGSFISKKTENHSISTKGHLDAVASFFSESDNLRDTSEQMPKQATHQVWTPNRQIVQRKPEYDQIYFERCEFPRPLFFCGAMPHRVTNEIERLRSSNDIKSKAFQGAVESLYQGRDLKGLFGGIAKDSELGGDSTINLYEPVWGCKLRLDRENRIKEGLRVEGYSPGSKCSDDFSSEGGSVEDKMLQYDELSELSATEKNVEGKDAIVDQDMSAQRMCESLFSQYARGDLESDSESNLESMSTLTSVPESECMNSGTFRSVHLSSSQRSDSFDGSELKRQVGLSDNLYKALQSFNTDSAEGSRNVSLTAVDAGPAAAEAANAILETVKDGRPLTNFELTNGLVPLYGCDDTPLPNGLDLDIFETKEDEIQSMKMYGSQAVIESKAVPNIFGPVLCPSPSTGPNDSRSWFYRMAPKNGSKTFESSSGSIDSYPPVSQTKSGLPLPPPPPVFDGSFQVRGERIPTANSLKTNASNTKSLLAHGQTNNTSGKDGKDKTSQRVGWWNTHDDFGMKPPQLNPIEPITFKADPPLQISPSMTIVPEGVKPLLGDSVEKIFQENRSLSDLHPSVATTKYLPYLSDRSPNMRYIQVDTQMVGFPLLSEVEPYFCSLAIWNIDGIRSGRVTESLHFDVVSDADVEVKCERALWPAMKGMENDQFHEGTPLRDAPENRLQGTRCGVFPLSPDLNIDNLFAVLIVHKVLSEDCDLEIYFNSTRQKGEDRGHQPMQPMDVARARNKAGRSADRLGLFLMPFSFGVAPLVQILGREAPTIPTSRAAQIPLFTLAAGKGEQPIIDHAIAMQ